MWDLSALSESVTGHRQGLVSLPLLRVWNPWWQQEQLFLSPPRKGANPSPPPLTLASPMEAAAHPRGHGVY